MVDEALTSESDERAGAQRALVGLRRRRQLFALVADYNRLRRAHPDVCEVIDAHIADALDRANRTREHDRKTLLHALTCWGRPGLTFEDLRAETELSDWTLRSLLAELTTGTPPVVGVGDRAPVGEIGRPARIYFLRATDHKVTRE